MEFFAEFATLLPENQHLKCTGMEKNFSFARKIAKYSVISFSSKLRKDCLMIQQVLGQERNFSSKSSAIMPLSSAFAIILASGW
ncbi:MAG: hypothetical protein LBT04_02985 [Prevotellaceae bacterium]|jgi:hypothetical protein|nr:hypothetical protein [Prevotellaceae bacterium]